MTEELEEIGAVPAAVSPGAPAEVTDEEFDAWVKRSQGDTEAVLAEWDTSVEFEARRYGDGGMVMDVEVLPDDDVDAILSVTPYSDPELEADEAAAAAQLPNYQELRDRIRNGETIGEINRQQVLGGRASACGDPDCPVCSFAAQLIDGYRPAPPVPRVDPMLELIRQRLEAMQARGRLERQGFVVVDCDTRPRASGLVLPSDDVVAWAKREFAVPTQREVAPPDNVTLTPMSYVEWTGELSILPARQTTWSVVPTSV